MRALSEHGSVPGPSWARPSLPPDTAPLRSAARPAAGRPHPTPAARVRWLRCHVRSWSRFPFGHSRSFGRVLTEARPPPTAPGRDQPSCRERGPTSCRVGPRSLHEASQLTTTGHAGVLIRCRSSNHNSTHLLERQVITNRNVGNIRHDRQWRGIAVIARRAARLTAAEPLPTADVAAKRSERCLAGATVAPTANPSPNATQIPQANSGPHRHVARSTTPKPTGDQRRAPRTTHPRPTDRPTARTNHAPRSTPPVRSRDQRPAPTAHPVQRHPGPTDRPTVRTQLGAAGRQTLTKADRELGGPPATTRPNGDAAKGGAQQRAGWVGGFRSGPVRGRRPTRRGGRRRSRRGWPRRGRRRASTGSGWRPRCGRSRPSA